VKRVLREARKRYDTIRYGTVRYYKVCFTCDKKHGTKKEAEKIIKRSKKDSCSEETAGLKVREVSPEEGTEFIRWENLMKEVGFKLE